VIIREIKTLDCRGLPKNVNGIIAPFPCRRPKAMREFGPALEEKPTLHRLNILVVVGLGTVALDLVHIA
jgi:hypothetical protein